MAKVGIVMGSDSDLPCMSEAAKTLEKLGIDYELTIVSAHRTPGRLESYAREAENRGVSVIIAGAGGAAHLPGMLAAYSPLPVVGVPIKTKALNGVDSLYSIVQMPAGVPVATVAIGGAANAGILAASILGACDTELRERVRKYKDEMQREVSEKAKLLEEIGYDEYLRRKGE